MAGYYENQYEYDFWFTELGRVLDDDCKLKEVVSYVKREEYQELIKMMTDLLNGYRTQTAELKQSQKEIEQLELQIKQADTNKIYIIPPARRSDLNDDIIIAKYNEGKSIYSIAKDLSCEPKTIKQRLIKSGVTLRVEIKGN